MGSEPQYFKADFPTGRSGHWILEEFAVPAVASTQRDPRPHWLKSPPGRYTRLRCGDRVFMTDLYDEWWTQRSAMQEACRRGGHVLITGLGLALVVDSILRSPSTAVEKVTVVEAAEDVIDLVAPHVLGRFGDQLEIVHGSAFTWNPPPKTHYSVVWHDIWENPQESSAEAEIASLEERFAPFCDWQGSWPRDYLAAVEESTRELGSE